MKKTAKIIIALLLAANCYTIGMLVRTDCDKAQVKAAEEIIEMVRNDQPDYFYDILVETDAYHEFRYFED